MHLNEADRQSILSKTFTTVDGRKIKVASGLRLKNNPNRKADYDRAVSFIKSIQGKNSPSIQNKIVVSKNKPIHNVSQELKIYEKYKSDIDQLISDMKPYELKEWNDAIQFFRKKFKTKHTHQELAAEILTGISSVDILKRVKITYINSYISNNGVSLSMDISVADHNNNTSNIYINRAFYPSTKTVKHSEFEIENPNLRGHGIAKKVFVRSLQFYDSVGITSIKLEAGMSAGGYAWLRFGAIPDKHSWERLRNEILDMIHRYGNQDVLPAPTQKLISKLLHQKSPTTALALAAIPKWGKRYLSGTWWHGAFDLKKNTLSRKTLEGYLQSA